MRSLRYGHEHRVSTSPIGVMSRPAPRWLSGGFDLKAKGQRCDPVPEIFCF